jgi:hypothetical protein
MTYQCPKGHQSTDSDYCSECGALIGKSKISEVDKVQDKSMTNLGTSSAGAGEICPDCGAPRVLDSRFCEVCRHDFQENKTGVAEVIVAAQQSAIKKAESIKQDAAQPKSEASSVKASQAPAARAEENLRIIEKLNVVISVDTGKASSCDIETPIKPDKMDRTFPLDLAENLVGRRSTSKGIFPEITINDPGVSHRHLMFIKQQDGNFAVLELGSSNGTELNGAPLEPGITTPISSGDELTIGLWTKLKLVSR